MRSPFPDSVQKNRAANEVGKSLLTLATQLKSSCGNYYVSPGNGVV